MAARTGLRGDDGQIGGMEAVVFGVLIFVFAPLDMIVQGNRLTTLFIVTTIFSAFSLIVARILLEVLET